MGLKFSCGAISVILQLFFLSNSIIEGKNIINEAELKLMTKLFPKPATSRKDVLPVANESSPVVVKLQIALRQIMDVEEKSQVISVSLWIRQYWNNPMLTWNKTKYNNISSINVDRDLVWVPDMCLYNTAEDSSSLYHRLDTKVIVSSNGDCTWLAPVILKSECKINVKYFPFDEQLCRLKFGSWTYNGKRIDVFPKEKSADLASYIKNGEWKMMSVPVKRNVEFFPCCTEPYPSVTFTIKIRRRMLYYVSNLIIPCGVIAALAFLSFYLPAESGERISLVITVLLAMTVYMLMVSSSMPPTSEVIPLIGKYYLAVMIEIALCLIATCVTIKWYYTDTPMPRWLHSIVIRFLGTIVCSKKEEQSVDVSFGKKGYNVNNNQNAMGQVTGYEVATPRSMNNVQLQEIVNYPSTEMETIHKDLTVISRKIKKEQMDEETRQSWRKAAEVLDRVFFVIFFVTFVLFSVIIFATVPYREN